MLKLDFEHPAPRPHWTAWLLLAAGLAAAAWTGWQAWRAQEAFDRAVAEAPHAAQVPAPRRATAAARTDDTAARSAREQLATPWSELFMRLEGNLPKRIALVTLEADTRKLEATLTAEARNAKDMLAYVEQLKDEAGFTTVTLASHALQEADPQQPLRFIVRLGWKP